MKKKKLIYIVFTIMVIIFVVLFASAVPGLAHGGGGGHGWGWGPGWGWGLGWGPWWGWGPAAYPYPYYGYYAQQPIVIQQQPPVYDQPMQQPEQPY